MKKTKILLVGALLFGVPSVALSLSTQQENVTVVRAAEKTATMTSFTNITSNNIGGDTNVSYFCAKGNSSTAPAIYNDEIRLYQNSDGIGGGTITIKSVDGCVLTSVTIGSSMETSIAYTINSETTKSTTTSLVANDKSIVNLSDKTATSITFYCMGTTSKTRLYVNYLSVTYSAKEKTLVEEIKNIETKTKLKFNYTKTTKENTFVSSAFDFANMGLSDKKVVSEFNDNNFNVLFDKSDGNTAPIYYKKGTGIRTYANNTISISSKNVINNVKLILDKGGNSNSITIDKGEIKTNTTIEKSIVNINSNELIIKVNGTTGHIRIQKLIINERSDEDIASYTNFSNLQLQYRYSFDVSSYIDEVQEIGMFVTDDKSFDFNTTGIYNDESTFESKVNTKNGFKGMRFINSSKKDTYTIGINLGNEIKGALKTTFRVGTYVKTNNKYYFSPKISEYNLETMLEKYNTMELESEGNAVIASFLAYVKTL